MRRKVAIVCVLVCCGCPWRIRPSFSGRVIGSHPIRDGLVVVACSLEPYRKQVGECKRRQRAITDSRGQFAFEAVTIPTISERCGETPLTVVVLCHPEATSGRLALELQVDQNSSLPVYFITTPFGEFRGFHFSPKLVPEAICRDALGH